MTTQNTIKTFNYNRNPRGAYLYTMILSELFLAARDDSKHGKNWDLLDEYYKAMAGRGIYKGISSSERASYMQDKQSDLRTGEVEKAFKDSKYSYGWFIEQHNRAVDIAKSYDRERIDYIF